MRISPILALTVFCAGCGSAADPQATAASNVSTDKAAAIGQAGKAPAFALGINLPTVNWWDMNRPFANLIYGSSWQMQNTAPWGGYENVPASMLDGNGWVKSVPAGYRLLRSLSVPAAGGDFTCKFDGNGALAVEGAAVSNVRSSAGSLRFQLAPTYPDGKSALLNFNVDASNYIRNIDCRETGSSATTSLSPEFLSLLTGFKTLRFMEWQLGTTDNTPVTWASRNKVGDGDYLRNDGVPVELIVQTANSAGADAWVTVPWNADDDYVTRFATYVRDNLASGRQVYVEVSNEVWNGGSAVGAQACAEAKAEKLASINGGDPCNRERYAEKTKQVMQIWSTVFAGQMNRLVRVAGMQHVSPWWTNASLSYLNLAQSVDAVATAPYFGADIVDSMTLDQAMAALPGKATEAVNLGVQQKATAQKFGLRYVTYEGGQHVVLPNSLTLEQQIQRDPRMFDVYQQFISAWRDQVGDQLNLFTLIGSISQYGGWGLSEYPGQPLTGAPKLRAARSFMNLKKGPPLVVSPVTTCPDGSTPNNGKCPGK